MSFEGLMELPRQLYYKFSLKIAQPVNMIVITTGLDHHFQQLFPFYLSQTCIRRSVGVLSEATTTAQTDE